MARRPNPYQRDPALASAFSNIASMFAPPSGSDVANYAIANAKRAEAERAAQLDAVARNPNLAPDEMRVLDQRMAIGAGGWNNSRWKIGMDDATTRRGQDVTASTSRANNAADNQRAMAQTRYGAVGEGQILPAMPGSVAEMYGLPEQPEQRGTIKLSQNQTAALPDGATMTGINRPVTMDEWTAQNMERQRQAGAVTDQQIVDLVMGRQSPVTVMGPDGKPVYAAPGTAARMQLPAAAAPSSTPIKRDTGTAFFVDGRQAPVTRDPTSTQWVMPDGSPVPADAKITNMATPQGSNNDLGVGKPVVNDIDKQLLDIAVAKDTAVALRDLISKSPASQGVVGWMRGTAQNLVQTGGELGSYFGGRMAEVSDAIQKGTADAGLAGAFDPNIPAIQMMANLLAFQYAKTTTGERLSNEMLKAARAALGLDGLDANQANSLARINEAVKRIEAQQGILTRARGGGTSAVSSAAPPAPAATPVAPRPGGAERWERGPDGNLRKVQ